MRYSLTIIASLTFQIYCIAQTKSIKIIDSVYTKSIIKLSYVNDIPDGRYECWRFDGSLKEEGFINNSKINREHIDEKKVDVINYVDSFHVAQNHKNFIDNKANVFSSLTGNSHKYICLNKYKDTLNKVVYDYFNSFKVQSVKYYENKEKRSISIKQYFKVVDDANGNYLPKLDSMYCYNEKGKLTYYIIAEVISSFKSSKIWAEKTINLDNKNNSISEKVNYYETINNKYRDVVFYKNTSFLKGKKTVSYFIVDSWNNLIKI